MKDILDLYAKPLDALHPLVCFDEQSVQLLADSRVPLPMKPGRPRRQDHEYVRQGTRNVFMCVEPHAGRRHVLVTQRRTKEDFAKVIRYLVDVVYPHAEYLSLVLDNLNTHTVETLIEIYGKAEADRLMSKLRFNYTPVHASWLNIAEIELSAMTRQVLSRRIPCEWTLSLELIAWEHERNRLSIPIKWSFDWKRAKRVFAKQIGELRGRTTLQN
jgi:DDE superfamily endonuclease